MEKVTVIIEKNTDGSYTAAPHHNYKVGFFGQGNTVEEALDDLNTSLEEARGFVPNLPKMEWDLNYAAAYF